MYADDLVVLAPTRSGMAVLLKVCEQYAIDHNIVWSTDVNPRLSKTKVLFLCGDNRRDYPAPLLLDGRELPFVTSATHLGHELSQDCSLDLDAKIKRAGFIDRSTAVRETFSFADPVQVISAVGTYCGDHYGSMLWPLYGEAAQRYYRCYNTCVKLAWGCPRSTHTFYVRHLLAQGVVPIRTQILSRYVKYVQTLLKGASPAGDSVRRQQDVERHGVDHRVQHRQAAAGDGTEHVVHYPGQGEGGPVGSGAAGGRGGSVEGHLLGETPGPEKSHGNGCRGYKGHQRVD